MDLFADYLEYEMIGKLSHRLLESKLKKLDVKKFHICRELNEKGYIKYWAIYNNENLFDPENKPILDSNKNDLVDLELFIDKIKKEK